MRISKIEEKYENRIYRQPLDTATMLKLSEWWLKTFQSIA